MHLAVHAEAQEAKSILLSPGQVGHDLHSSRIEYTKMNGQRHDLICPVLVLARDDADHLECPTRIYERGHSLGSDCGMPADSIAIVSRRTDDESKVFQLPAWCENALVIINY